MYKYIINRANEYHIDIKGVLGDEDGYYIAEEIKVAAEAGVKELFLNINSYGGSVRAAWDIISACRKSGIKTRAINQGFALSAGAVLLASADYAEAYDYSTAMIHDPLLGGRTLEDTEGKDKEFLTKIKDGIISIFKKKMKCDEKELYKMLKRETSFNAKEQKEYGLVDSIIERPGKPIFTDSMETLEIYNIIESHNKKIEEMKEIKNYLKLEEDANEETVLNIIKEHETKLEETTNKLEEVTKELDSLKLQNFILSNSLVDKKETIEAAVEKHGIEVLETILDFIKVGDEPTKNEVEDTKEEDNELLQNVIDIVNNANDILDENVVENTELSSESKLQLANEIFDINGDAAKREEIKKEQPEFYNELFEIYENSL